MSNVPKALRVYLAGPMSGYPKFNFPAFHAATAKLRAQGFEVVSPAEEDHKAGIGDDAEASKNGDPNDLKETWGQILARDVIILADTGIQGIVFLPDWEKSRGARLEAQVGLLQKGFKFFTYNDGNVITLLRTQVSFMLHKRVIEEQIIGE